MRYTLLLVPMTFAAGDWLAVAQNWRHLEYVCKPATMVALLVSVWLWTQGPHDAWQARFFLAGFALSLAGDVFLMLRREGLFVAGLVAFLLAHGCYTVGLNPTVPPGASLVVLIPIAGGGTVLLRRIARGLRERGRRTLLAAVTGYSLMISAMLFSVWATLFRPAWGTLRASLAVVGGSLFYISDVLVGWDRFVKPSSRARLWIHMTYHLGQMGLAASIILPLG